PALSRARPCRPLWRGPGLLGRPLATDGIVGPELIKRLARPRQHHDARAERHRRAGAEREGEYQREGSRPHLRVPSHLWSWRFRLWDGLYVQPPGAPGRVVLVPPFRRPGGVARCMRASLPQERESRLNREPALTDVSAATRRSPAWLLRGARLAGTRESGVKRSWEFSCELLWRCRPPEGVRLRSARCGHVERPDHR